ncbi:MAG: tRNA (adenosine(37)-N6)-threonylcarbamoyltransferase complex dimerization subunit type 1 TsaB [Bacteroidota bacterium]
MSLILSIETATRTCSVALHTETQLLATQTLYVANSHAEMLHQTIEHLLAISARTIQDLEAVAVSNGPGSYTGLRIGFSVAKGLCYALELPLIAIPTLSAMAHGIQPYNTEQALRCPMIDARRMEVYCMLVDAQDRVLMPLCAMVVDDASFQAYLQHTPVLFFGDGAAKCRPLLMRHSNASFVEDVTPTAQSIGQLAQKKFQQGIFEDLASAVPIYLKPFGGKPSTSADR